jgi:hypothetical protein
MGVSVVTDYAVMVVLQCNIRFKGCVVIGQSK